MVTFCLLVAPLPHSVRRNVFKFISGSWIVAKIAYALKIAFMYGPVHQSSTWLTMHIVLSEFSLSMLYSACTESQLRWSSPSLPWPQTFEWNPVWQRENSSKEFC